MSVTIPPTYSQNSEVVTRFAPSPTGYMHLGHAYAALFAWRTARQQGGRFVIRIEDIDVGRSRAEFDAAVFEDLEWLGANWDGTPVRQSERFDVYGEAITRLEELGVIYPCFCTRSQIREEMKRAGGAPQGDEGPHYPGTCRELDPEEREDRMSRGVPFGLRLDVAAAAARTGPLQWTDLKAGIQQADPEFAGDIVVARKDTPTSYHLAVTIDDHLQGVTVVTRGSDLFRATHIHRLLQALLGLDVPVWHHHPVITDSNGQRLAKRNRAMTLRGLRQAGKSAAEVRALVGFD